MLCMHYIFISLIRDKCCIIFTSNQIGKMGEVLVLGLASVLVILIGRWVYRWRNPKCVNGKLPPGSMGFPLLGETLAFIATHDFYGIPPFVRTRMTKYGPIFKTNLIGKPVVLSTDPEFNNYIFQQEGKLFQIQYPESFSKIIGTYTMTRYHGVVHKYIKNLIFNQISPQRLKDELLGTLNGKIRAALISWTDRPEVNVREAVADIIFDLIASRMFSYDEAKEKKNLRQNYQDFIDGLFTFPLNIPGTTFHTCLKGRRAALKLIKDKYSERKASSRKGGGDFLDVLLAEVERKGAFLTEAAAIELLFVIPFGAFETTSRNMALLVKFITENPSVVTKLTEEHEEILKVKKMNNGDEEPGVTWDEYKSSMPFTHMVINETLRLSNVVPGIFRRTTQDIKINGYTIPEGWTVMVYPGVAHLDSINFEDPLKFNPWRWEGKDMQADAASRTFMPFGGGLRHCVGAELAKAEMALFIHHLVPAYRWKIIGGGEVMRSPGVSFPNGFRIQIWSKFQ